MERKEPSGKPDGLSDHSQGCRNLGQPDRQSNHHPDEASVPRRARRIVHFGDPDYFDHLPPHLQYLSELPFAIGSFGFYPPSYELDWDDATPPDSGEEEADRSTNCHSEEC